MEQQSRCPTRLHLNPIPTSFQLRAYLEAYWDQAGKQYLFSGRHGREHLHPRSADAILREACEQARLDGLSTHSFQRLALTAMSAAGGPLRVIQQVSGHRSLQALQKYLEVSEQQIKSAISTLQL